MEKKPLPVLPFGMGSYSYHLLPNGTENILYQKTVGESGNKKRLTVYGDTVSECNKKMRAKEQAWELEQREKRHSDPRNAGLTFGNALYQWLVKFKRSELKGRSYDTLEGIYERYVVNADFANKQVEQVTDTDIQTWLLDIENRLSVSTAKKCRTLVNMYFDYYYVRWPMDNPMLTVPKIKSEKSHAIQVDENGTPIHVSEEDNILNDDEIERFEAAARTKYQTGKPIYKYGLLYLFAIWTFLRYGEIVALQWRDIDFDKRLVTVNKNQQRIRTRDKNGERVGEKGERTHNEIETPKTLSSNRTVMLCDKAIDALKEYREENCPNAGLDDFIFTTSGGEPVSDQHIDAVLISILKRAGIEKHIRFHDLRHTGISFFLRHGVSPDFVSRMAGHSSIKTTSEIYYSMTDRQMREEIAKVNNK